MKEDVEDDFNETKLLPTDADQSISTAETAACAPVNSEFPSAKDAEITEKDGRWAWVVCGAAFCDLFVVLGMHYTVGVLYAALLDHFKESKVLWRNPIKTPVSRNRLAKFSQDTSGSEVEKGLIALERVLRQKCHINSKVNVKRLRNGL